MGIRFEAMQRAESMLRYGNECVSVTAHNDGNAYN